MHYRRKASFDESVENVSAAFGSCSILSISVKLLWPCNSHNPQTYIGRGRKKEKEKTALESPEMFCSRRAMQQLDNNRPFYISGNQSKRGGENLKELYKHFGAEHSIKVWDPKSDCHCSRWELISNRYGTRINHAFSVIFWCFLTIFTRKSFGEENIPFLEL